MTKAYHGGAFFRALGEDFSKLHNSGKIISADVLDAWFDPAPRVIKKLERTLAFALKTSPPTHCEGMLDTISKVRNIPRGNLLAGSGSSDLIFRSFLDLVAPGEKVMILDPTYGEYAHVLEHLIGARILRHRLRKEKLFVVEKERLLKDVRARAPKTLVLVNPNSPTGQYVDKNNMLSLLRLLPKNTRLIIDEAYMEYVSPKESMEREAAKRKGLIVIKSMSKAYALSGVRAAYMVADRRTTERLGRLTPPWSVSLPAQMAAVEALKSGSYYRKRYKETHALRREMAAHLEKLPGIKIYPSVANFILLELGPKNPGAEQIVQHLRKENIFIRNCDSMSRQFQNRFLRIAVKDRVQNKKIWAGLAHVLTINAGA